MTATGSDRWPAGDDAADQDPAAPAAATWNAWILPEHLPDTGRHHVGQPTHRPAPPDTPATTDTPETTAGRQQPANGVRHGWPAGPLHGSLPTNGSLPAQGSLPAISYPLPPPTNGYPARSEPYRQPPDAEPPTEQIPPVPGDLADEPTQVLHLGGPPAGPVPVLLPDPVRPDPAATDPAATGASPPVPAQPTQLDQAPPPAQPGLAQPELAQLDQVPPPAQPGRVRLPHPPRSVVRKRARRRRLLEWPFLVAFSLLAALLLRTFVVQTFYIPSQSMHDTLLEGDRVLVNKLAYHLHNINRGDVIVFRRPVNLDIPDNDLIKRVIGLPGDRLEARNGAVYVNGRLLTEPYIQRDCTKGTLDLPPTVVPAGYIFVMGDNRCDSTDSRIFGPIKESLVVGRAFVLIWPPGRIGWL